MKRILTTIICAAVLAAPGPFGAAPASAEFTFKRVKPPEAGTRKLINIHVEPVPEVARVLPTVPDVPAAPVPGRKSSAGTSPPASPTMEWFWAEMSPALSDAGYGKLSRALGVIEGRAGDLARLAPPPERLSRILDAYGGEILKATAGTQVSPALVLSVIAVESNGIKDAKSHAGAVGLMQLMPATAKRFGVTDRTDPADNIAGGVKYLDFLLTEFGGDALLALAAYNAGEGAVTRAGGVPAYAETRAYVPKVVGAWRTARMLCMAPPVRATDGCLFTGMKIASQ